MDIQGTGSTYLKFTFKDPENQLFRPPKIFVEKNLVYFQAYGGDTIRGGKQ